MDLLDEVWIASAGDTFDIVAFYVYGDENYASEIMSVNPTLCGNMEFQGGEILKLPVIDIPDDDEEDEDYAAANAPWKE